MNNKIEISGFITKEEKLKSIDKNIIPETLVLETVDPFGGYYNEDPHDKNLQTVYIITNGNDSLEQISKATQRIKTYIDQDFDAGRAEVFYYNKQHIAIRLYDIKNYSIIEELQNAYKSEGITLMDKHQNLEITAVINIFKTFYLNEVEQGLYINLSKSPMGYFTINKQFNWKHFSVIVKKVKNNWNGDSFDAACGIFFRKNEIQNIVRIYCKSINEQMLKDLRKAFNTEISRIN